MRGQKYFVNYNLRLQTEGDEIHEVITGSFRSRVHCSPADIKKSDVCLCAGLVKIVRIRAAQSNQTLTSGFAVLWSIGLRPPVHSAT